jgi:hypothetical protein
MADIILQLPYYLLNVTDSSDRGYGIRFNVSVLDDGALPGYTQDDIANIIRDELVTLTGVTNSLLHKHTDVTTVL